MPLVRDVALSGSVSGQALPVYSRAERRASSYKMGANWEQDWQYGSNAATMQEQRESDVADCYFSICNENQRESNIAEMMKRVGSGPSGLNGPCRFNSCLRQYLRQFGQRVRIRFSATTAPSRRFRGGTRRWPGCGRIGRCCGARSPPPPAPRSRRREPQPTDTRCAACAGPRPARRRAGRTARRGCERRRDASERPGDDPHAVPRRRPATPASDPV